MIWQEELLKAKSEITRTEDGISIEVNRLQKANESGAIN